MPVSSYDTALFWRRFDAKIERVPFSDCHYWMGALRSHGYGEVKVDGRKESAHRVSFRRANGFMPNRKDSGLLVRHTCDQPICVNPDHLVVGTQGENMQDKRLRGRAPKGESHYRVKLSDAEVAEIKALALDGWQTSALAETYNVSKSLISTIRHGRVEGSSRAVNTVKPTGRTDRRMSDENALEIFCRLAKGERRVDLAHEYGVKLSFISDIKRGATYASVTGYGRVS